MTRKEFEEYLEQQNMEALPFVPLKNCYRCGKPITKECAILTDFSPPRWFHIGCLDAETD